MPVLTTVRSLRDDNDNYNNNNRIARLLARVGVGLRLSSDPAGLVAAVGSPHTVYNLQHQFNGTSGEPVMASLGNSPPRFKAPLLGTAARGGLWAVRCPLVIRLD
jgi:hypothetical protein